MENNSKIFPRFERDCFRDPERLFHGFTVKDFIQVVQEVRNSKDTGFPHAGYDTALFSGWVDAEDSTGLSARRGWDIRVNIQTMWASSIVFIPSALNQAIFPYMVTVTESLISFDEIRYLYNKNNVGRKQYYPYPVIEKAMLNTSLPLAQALLLEGFTGGAIAVEKDAGLGQDLVYPLVSLGEVEEAGLLNYGVPFDMFKESLVFLGGGRVPDGYSNVIDLAEKINRNHVG